MGLPYGSATTTEAVLAGLQQHPRAPHLIKEFARTHQEERERLANEKRTRRSRLASQLAKAQRGIDRLWSDYEAERISMDIAGPKLKDLHAQKTELEAELAETPAEHEKVVGLRPAALQQYEQLVAELQALFGKGVTHVSGINRHPCVRVVQKIFGSGGVLTT